MAKALGATLTTEEVLAGMNLQGKRILVTGVSAGLGVETARSLAAHGAHVVGAARDLNKAEAATTQVRKDAAAGGGSFEVVELDLGNLESVRACADKLVAKGEPFDAIIANAGVMAGVLAHSTHKSSSFWSIFMSSPGKRSCEVCRILLSIRGIGRDKTRGLATPIFAAARADVVGCCR